MTGGYVYTGVCLLIWGVPQSHFLSQVSGPRSFPGGYPSLWSMSFLGGTPASGPMSFLRVPHSWLRGVPQSQWWVPQSQPGQDWGTPPPGWDWGSPPGLVMEPDGEPLAVSRWRTFLLNVISSRFIDTQSKILNGIKTLGVCERWDL